MRGIPFKAGDKRINRQGRPLGQKNKVTSELKAWLTEVIDENQDKFRENLSKLEPEKHVQIIEKLFAYVLPKPQSIDLKLEYMELERLLKQTPEQYIERISAKILQLNHENTE